MGGERGKKQSSATQICIHVINLLLIFAFLWMDLVGRWAAIKKGKSAGNHSSIDLWNVTTRFTSQKCFKHLIIICKITNKCSCKINVMEGEKRTIFPSQMWWNRVKIIQLSINTFKMCLITSQHCEYSNSLCLFWLYLHTSVFNQSIMFGVELLTTFLNFCCSWLCGSYKGTHTQHLEKYRCNSGPNS